MLLGTVAGAGEAMARYVGGMAITKAHRYTMSEWVREHGDTVRETFKHPATSSNKKSWWDRMRKWCDASKVPLDDLKAMMADESAEGSEA